MPLWSALSHFIRVCLRPEECSKWPNGSERPPGSGIQEKDLPKTLCNLRRTVKDYHTESVRPAFTRGHFREQARSPQHAAGALSHHHIMSHVASAATEERKSWMQYKHVKHDISMVIPSVHSGTGQVRGIPAQPRKNDSDTLMNRSSRQFKLSRT